MRRYLVLDVNFLAWRAYHTTGKLSYGETATGVIFGILKDIKLLSRRFDTNRLVFCFDHGKSLRYKKCPTYKIKRVKKKAAMSDSEKKKYNQFQEQIDLLRTEHLRAIGFRNILFQAGYEADDMIASFVQNMSFPDSEAVIVSADGDMLQLLAPNVSVYNPVSRKKTTLQSFKRDKGISPRQWINVKCLMGCGTDDIPGISGVGEKSAIAYLKGKLGTDTIYYRRIIAGLGIVRINRPLIKLPMEGCRVFPIKKDCVTDADWNNVTQSMGMRSLRRRSK